jgi:hypothetical protein
MTNLLGQLKRWRRTEQLIRLAWGAARVVAVAGVVLALACAIDWLADRYLGSEAWRKFRTATWVFAPRADAVEDWSPDAVIDETPFWLRLLMTTGQLALAAGLVAVLVVRPWRRTPPIDDLAGHAEKVIPAFGHRLVTAVQLNRPGARTQGMSRTLIDQVTREAGEMAASHNLLKLVDYRRLPWAAAVAIPVLFGWAGFVLAKPELATVLLKRQALLSVEIPRTIHLKNASQDVWPTGSRTEIRYLVTGDYDRDTVGRVRVEPDGQPEFYTDLKYEKDADGGAYFVASLPESTSDYSFSARLGNGRSRERGRIRFEAPPQTTEIESWQLLPAFLGTRDGKPFEKQNEGAKRGEIVDALPGSAIRIGAVFSKPVKSAVLTPIQRGDGLGEVELPPAKLVGMSDDRTAAEWTFPTTPKMIAYQIRLVDDRGFVNAVPIRRNVRMLEDRPPVVTFLPESDRHPDPNDFYGKGDPKTYEWGDKLPLPEGGRVMVIYHADSPQGVSRVNIRYRVIPRGIDSNAYPKEVQEIQHPSQDPEARVYKRLVLKPVQADPKVVGAFVPDLGLFERSWDKLTEDARDRVNIEFYSIPALDPRSDPSGLEAGGRYNFEIGGLEKTLPDGSTSKLEVGDAVELYVEAFDKNPAPGRAPGFTKEARRKIVVTPKDAADAIAMREEQSRRLQNKLNDLVKDQANVFRGSAAEPKK